MNLKKGVGAFARHSCSSILPAKCLSEGRSNEPAGAKGERGLGEMEMEVEGPFGRLSGYKLFAVVWRSRPGCAARSG
jgi:hypothetical protein